MVPGGIVSLVCHFCVKKMDAVAIGPWNLRYGFQSRLSVKLVHSLVGACGETFGLPERICVAPEIC